MFKRFLHEEYCLLFYFVCMYYIILYVVSFRITLLYLLFISKVFFKFFIYGFTN